MSQGRSQLVTGASSGLGWRFARDASPGGRHRHRCRATRRQGWSRWPRRSSPREAAADAVALDVTHAESIPGVLDDIEATEGQVTILVNNAGVPDAQRFHKMPLSLIDTVLDTNVRAPYVLACEVARRLIATGAPGRIVNLSSAGSFHYGGGGAALYSISKAAINRMTEVLAVEWKRAITSTSTPLRRVRSPPR
ncbi:MAG: SDR family oxidoreductase [Ilumatobacteraceae bacterium]